MQYKLEDIPSIVTVLEKHNVVKNNMPISNDFRKKI